ncbi:MAG: 50S ribosomal protein L10 [Limnothrix sp.]
MGKSLAEKQVLVAEIKDLLKDAQLTFVIDYKGLTVAEISDLRNRLRPSGAFCKIAKNTLMHKAVEGDENWQPIQPLLRDSSAFLIAGEDISSAIKAYKEFQKATKKTELRGGVMEGQALSKDQIEAIGDLPTKEELYGQIAGAINAVTTKIAVGINEVPSSLARAIQAVAEKDAA